MTIGSRRSFCLVAAFAMLATACSSTVEDSNLSSRRFAFAEVAPRGAFPGSPSVMGQGVVQLLPGLEVYEQGVPVSGELGDRDLGDWQVLSGGDAESLTAIAAGFASSNLPMEPAQAGLAFVGPDGLAAGQVLSVAGDLWTVVFEVVSQPTESGPDAGSLLAFAEFIDLASSTSYSMQYRRLFENTSRTNLVTGIETRGDHGEQFDASATSNLAGIGRVSVTQWTFTVDGRDLGAVPEAEWLWTDDDTFFRAGCSLDDVATSDWVVSDSSADSQASLFGPGYVSSLLERLEAPVVLVNDDDGTTVEFLLRGYGLLGEPWPLSSFGDEWTTKVVISIDNLGRPKELVVESARPADRNSGPGSDLVRIAFESWNQQVDEDRPANVILSPSWPDLCVPA